MHITDDSGSRSVTSWRDVPGSVLTGARFRHARAPSNLAGTGVSASSSPGFRLHAGFDAFYCLPGILDHDLEVLARKPRALPAATAEQKSSVVIVSNESFSGRSSRWVGTADGAENEASCKPVRPGARGRHRTRLPRLRVQILLPADGHPGEFLERLPPSPPCSTRRPRTNVPSHS